MSDMVHTDELAGAIMDALQAYTDDVTQGIKNAEDLTAKECKANLEADSPVGNTGDYQKGWKVTVTENTISEKHTVIHNKEYRLTHLLEDGQNRAAVERGRFRISSRTRKKQTPRLKSASGRCFKTDIKAWLEQAGEPVAETCFSPGDAPPSPPYVVFLDSSNRGGGDLKNMIRVHNLTVYSESRRRCAEPHRSGGAAAGHDQSGKSRLPSCRARTAAEPQR